MEKVLPAASREASEAVPTKKIRRANSPDPSAKFWRLPAVMAFTQRSRSSIYRDPDFPKPISLAPRTSAWVVEEVMQWADAKVASRDEGGVR